IALWVLVIVAAGLRLADLGGKSLWLDEAFSVSLARTPWHVFATELRTREANMGLYYLLLRGWLRLGTGEATVRLLSALAGILCIPVVYALGARLANRRTGVVAALILALDPLHIGLSQDARGYTLAVLLVTCSTWAFAHVILDPAPAVRMGPGAPTLGPTLGPRRRRSGAWWTTLYVIASVGAVYSHFYAAFVLVAQWASLLLGRAPRIPWRRLIASGLAMALLFIPLAAFVLHGGHHNLDWIAGEIPKNAAQLGRMMVRPVVVAVEVTYGTLFLILGWL